MRERTGSRRALECPAIGLPRPAVPQVDVISTSAREARRLPYSTKRTAVQVTFDNFGRAIQYVYATTLATTPPVSNPVAFNARGDELLGCFLLERIYSATVRVGASRWSFVHEALK